MSNFIKKKKKKRGAGRNKPHPPADILAELEPVNPQSGLDPDGVWIGSAPARVE